VPCALPSAGPANPAAGFLGNRRLAAAGEVGVPIPPSPKASQVLLAAFAERGIGWYPERLVRALDPGRL
jgi:sulfide:quinone oxidoreductase